MFALSIFSYLIWWLAFQQGGRIWIDVNFVGEMWIEYVLWGMIIPLITLSMYYYLKQENRISEATLKEAGLQNDQLSVGSGVRKEE